MKKKTISPVAINALKDTLTNIYWYKSELRSFIMHTISDPTILSRLNWNNYKRNIVANLIDYLVRHQDTHQNDLLKLMSEVTKMTDFSHLIRLEDGSTKAKKAEDSVKALRGLVQGHFDLIEAHKKIEERRQQAYQKILRKQGVADKLEEIKRRFYSLLGAHDAQKRGYQLEQIIKDLFTLFDLDPKASFKLKGEQIDGAFTFENTDYLFEAKWQQDLVGIKDLDAFNGKLARKLDNTLGLFISVNGFSEDAVKTHSTGRRLMILMDGSDLMAVLEGRIDLMQLLLRKRRYASQTGNIFLKIHEIMLGSDEIEN